MKRKVEIFTAGCPACDDAVQLVRSLACADCEITIHDMNDPAVAARARKLGIRTVPAVVVEGQIAACCAGSGPTETALRAAGIGDAA